MSTHIVEGLRKLALPIASLHEDQANARRHDTRNLDAIKASLAKFGQRKPIVVQKGGMVVRAGNGTLAAARALGWTEIAAVVVDEGDVEATAYAIADNRTAELASWDDDVLGSLLGQLQSDDFFDHLVTGFSDAEISRLLSPVAGESDPDEIPPVPEEPVARPGDLWLLGEHRLLCGDSTSPDDVAWLLDGAEPGPPDAEAARGHGAADREPRLPGGLRALQRLGHYAARLRAPSPPLLRHGDRPQVHRRRGPALGALHRQEGGGRAFVKRVFVCSPYRGEVARNIDVAREICRAVVLAGDAPLAPHLLYPAFLDDAVGAERALGCSAGLAWLAVADEILVVGPPTEGMEREISAANALGVPIRHLPRWGVDG